ncbi:NUDIX domain-containing protein [Streptomyces laculatispora]|uniref:NUDIX domain-containing protein n=1 Tax=Streptomyces laculatispora TaxID=887464 RepID=A0ABY9I0J5_9ACTN|nr:NUDIX domain-containing protein [Streptomyces laculatispora]WLQ40356.1 NUDIX domain-containing protein [Streptomyces laculatispora]
MYPQIPGTESASARGAVAIITNRHGQVLLHLRDDLPEIAWPAHWAVMGGSCEPGESPADTIIRELDDEAGLIPENLTELFEIIDHRGAGQIVTFFAASWDGVESDLLLAEGVKLQFFAPDYLDILTIPPFIRNGIYRHLATMPS